MGSNMGPEVPQRPLEASKNWVPLLDEPLYKPRRLRVVCVGAGYSGLSLAYEAKYNKALEGCIDLTIYDKNDDIGGTWLENRYPGVACDVPAHIYTFPFEPNPDWSTFFASGSEIWSYIKRTSDKYGLAEHVQLRSKVLQAIWDEPSSTWCMKIRQNGEEKEVECDVLVDGSGFLNNWTWPNIEGLHDFKGQLLHTANWNLSLDVTGKKVAVIGNGASAIQVLPQLQKTAAQLTNYIRSPTWIFSNHAAGMTKDGTNFAFTEEEKTRFRENPALLLKYRKEIESCEDNFFSVFFKNSQAQKAALIKAQARMRQRLGNDPDLCAKLIPNWELGCRRATPGDGYLEALCAENASVNNTPILRFTESGIQTAHEHTDFDIIVCATGFDVSYRPPWTVRGRNGHQLHHAWSDSPEAYFGIAAPNTPNYFIFIGPNSPVGHGTLLDSVFCVAKWILKWCRKMATEDIKSICVKQEALDDYNTYSQEFLKGMVWSGGCRSWYKNNKVDGPVTALYAGSRLHFRDVLETFRTEDFDIQYGSVNRFRFMGNGMTLSKERVLR
ncbi:hypothetical protein N7449_004252 [Penicillium cf. viridicatum]|uniref:Sterigmatocystin biosynthesis monooxygenase stcW n=1 Tax=Penicillium cf. viridicatum TaxID=2972119 RepID=A0A9W9SXR8_9EURO|nr:hypothetical protein N7449_004252 [Penicillium cf. viridicatum]